MKSTKDSEIMKQNLICIDVDGKVDNQTLITGKVTIVDDLSLRLKHCEDNVARQESELLGGDSLQGRFLLPCRRISKLSSLMCTQHVYINLFKQEACSPF